MRRAGARLLLLVVAGVVALVAAEAALRVCDCVETAMAVPNLSGFVSFFDNPARRFHFRSNSLAYRDSDHAVAKPPGVTRIVLFGDSHTNGVGVDQDDRFSNILERRLQARGRYEVINMGMPAANPPDYVQQKELAMSFAPDAVVVVVFSGNDPGEMAAWPGFIYWDGGGWRHLLLRRFHTYYLLGAVRSRFRSFINPPPPPVMLGEPPCALPLEDETSGTYLQAMHQVCHFILRPGVEEQAMQAYRGNMTTLIDWFTARGVKTYVFVLPPPLLVDPANTMARVAKVAERLGVSAADAVPISAKIQERLVHDTPRNATVVDLLPALTEAAHHAPQFFPRDWHLNPAGHATLAARLERVFAP